MSTKKFNTLNPESLIYQNELLMLTVLGGIKLEGLDRMRSTLKIELKQSSVPPVRHNLDLYNDTQTEKLIRKTAEKLEIGTSVIAASLAELTEQLEAYRLDQIKKSEANTQIISKVLSAQERKDAENFLKSKPLMQLTGEMIGKSGMIGEESNRLLMYLIFTSRKLNQPLHIVSLGASGTGKTHLQEKVGELIPEEDKIEITVLSENAFYYFGQRELKNKLILIEDLDGAESSLYPLRELQSKKRISKTIAHKNTKGETRTIHLVVEGPVSVSGCTTQEQIYEDNANRSFLIYLDESKEQDNRIMEYQRKLSAGKTNGEQEEAAQELMQNCQRILQPIKVINPFAELLSIPEEVLKPRRTNNHYLQFIEVITYYHQFQREPKVNEETGEMYIETTLEDVAAANELLKEILLRKSDELTGACRNYLEAVKSYLEQENKKGFTNREIRKALKVNPSNQKRYNLSLTLNYYIKQVKGKKGASYHYEIVSYKEFQELRNHIASVLDNNLKKLEGFTGPLPVQKKYEPVKVKSSSEINNQFTANSKKVS
ncbi:MAG: hypothetical protein HRT95_17910 [Moritella sp.]|uniref:hypothetical protein n=1 Tax=Moritella sp. TaxID=78556 RepID=UPI001D8F870F|nr:hypothetical protein [Moritella sp.]NQZ51974.1 hypothetical protein [Moritella sp.]